MSRGFGEQGNGEGSHAHRLDSNGDPVEPSKSVDPQRVDETVRDEKGGVNADLLWDGGLKAVQGTESCD